MAAVALKRLIRPFMVAGIAAIIVGCPMDLALKTTIKGLAAPPNVSSLKIITPASKTFQLSWVDPSDKDVDHIEISFSTPFASNPPPAPVNVAVGVQKATVTVPLNGVWYFITVKTVDKAGNKSPGITPVNLFNNNAKTLPYTAGLPAYELNYTVSGGVLPGTQSSYTTYTYSGGSSGNLTNRSYYTGLYPSGTISSYDAYTYDANGNQTRDNYFYYSGGIPTLSSYTISTYDSSGNMTQQSYFNGSGVLSSYTAYQYDANGNVTLATGYDSSGNATYTEAYTYDENYHIIKLVDTNIQYPQYSGTDTITWDPKTNFPSSITFTSSSGTQSITFAVSPGLLTETSTYNGTTSTYTINFNSYGLEVQDVGNNYSTVYNYDINGNRTDEVDYNSGVASYHYSWPYYY